eukprot:759264-Hanusia_phi.AAC.1
MEYDVEGRDEGIGDDEDGDDDRKRQGKIDFPESEDGDRDADKDGMGAKVAIVIIVITPRPRSSSRTGSWYSSWDDPPRLTSCLSAHCRGLELLAGFISSFQHVHCQQKSPSIRRPFPASIPHPYSLPHASRGGPPYSQRVPLILEGCPCITPPPITAVSVL